MKSSEKDKLFKKMKKYIKSNFHFQNHWNEYDDWDVLQYNKVAHKVGGCNTPDKENPKKTQWEAENERVLNSLLNDIKKIIYNFDKKEEK